MIDRKLQALIETIVREELNSLQLNEVSAISVGGAALSPLGGAGGSVAMSHGSSWAENDELHEYMWSEKKPPIKRPDQDKVKKRDDQKEDKE